MDTDITLRELNNILVVWAWGTTISVIQLLRRKFTCVAGVVFLKRKSYVLSKTPHKEVRERLVQD